MSLHRISLSLVCILLFASTLVLAQTETKPTVSPTPTPEAKPTPTPEAKPTPTPEPTPTPRPDPLSTGTFGGLRFRSIGPAVTSGRVIAFAVDPNDRAKYYVAVASGGIWKTVNSGTTWTSVFDNEGAFSIGAVTLDPTGFSYKRKVENKAVKM